ncbi:hypothetical protein [Salinifilum aidingensis]
MDTDADDTRRERTRRARYCSWCGQRVASSGKQGRPKQYCTRSCRQRAYERRTAVQRGGLPEDAVVLSAGELADLQDRVFQVRCAAEDIVTAVDDGADGGEVRKLAEQVAALSADLERLR